MLGKDWVDRINNRFCLTTSHPVILNSVISVSWYCYSRFRYIIFQFSCHFQIQISKLRLYQIPLYQFLLYQFPFSGYIRFCYIYFCYNIFQFHVITFSVISDSVISSSVISNSNLVISNSLYLIPLYQNLLYQIHCGPLVASKVGEPLPLPSRPPPLATLPSEKITDGWREGGRKGRATESKARERGRRNAFHMVPFAASRKVSPTY